MIWRIWYADGSTYSSEDGHGYPDFAPSYGVQVIAQPDRTAGVGNVGYVCLAGYDWYYYCIDDDEWAGAMGDASIWDLILHREPITAICQGRRMSRVRYQATLAEAQAWATAQGLPAKSGFRPDEIG